MPRARRTTNWELRVNVIDADDNIVDVRPQPLTREGAAAALADLADYRARGVEVDVEVQKCVAHFLADDPAHDPNDTDLEQFDVDEADLAAVAAGTRPPSALRPA